VPFVFIIINDLYHSIIENDSGDVVCFKESRGLGYQFCFQWLQKQLQKCLTQIGVVHNLINY